MSGSGVRRIVIGFVLILLVIFFTEERGATRPVPSSRSNSSSKVVLLRNQDLFFGGAITGTTAGTIIVNPNGLVSYTGGIMRNFHAGIPPAHPAQLVFTLYNAAHCVNVDHCISDDDEAARHEIDDTRSDDDRLDFIRHGLNVSVSLPSLSTLQLTSNPSAQMSADHFLLLRTCGSLAIGATLHVGAMQALGTYTGSFEVTVICE